MSELKRRYCDECRSIGEPHVHFGASPVSMPEVDGVPTVRGRRHGRMFTFKREDTGESYQHPAGLTVWPPI